MKKHLDQLLAQRKAKQEQMQALLNTAKDEKRSLSADEKTTYDGYEREFDEMTGDIKRVEKQIARDAELDQPQRMPLSGAAANHLAATEMRENPTDIPVDMRKYSLLRAVKALKDGNWDEATYERDCSLQIAEKLGRDAQGLFVPYEVQRAVMATAAGTGLADAGALVGTDHMDDMFIESLKADSIVVAAGAQVLTGLVGDVDIPRSLGGASFTWIGENGDSADTNPTLDTVAMSPKTISGSIPITRRLMKQSSPAVEALLYSDIRSGIALAIDAAAIAGDGLSDNPVGIIATTGVNTQAVADITNHVPTFVEAVGFETKLAEDNALRGNPIYLTTPAINGAAKTTAIDAGSGIMLNTSNTINGYPAKGSTLVPTGKTVFGNFNDVIIGMWGVMDITVDTATLAAKGGTVLRVFQDVDVAIRHPQSFCVTA